MAVQINVAANQAALVQSIQSGVDAYNRNFAKQNQINLQINSRSFSQPLGRITGDVKDFGAAMAASNARVIAFGASTAILGTAIASFKSLAQASVEVEKNLTDINRILNLSTENLQRYAEALFDIAKGTATSFDQASKALLEFSRQGLSAEETLKRTNDALTLTRLAGMDAADSVEALTATVNGFADTGITTTQVLNKLIAVEQSFAVSARDLSEGLSRTGQAAQEAGVNIDELNALITVAQQKTARGGAVIGNALKTIFTRLQRSETLDQLEAFNIAVRDVEGNILPAAVVLQNFAAAYKELGDASRAALSEQVAGVYQVNILKALVSDLNSEQSIYNKALLEGANASNQAQLANAKLNQTLSALLSQTSTGLTELSSNIGKITFEPLAKYAAETANSVIETFNEILTGEGLASDFAKGFLKGIRNIIGGPGAVAAFYTLFKLLQSSFSYLTQALPQIAGITTEAQNRKNIEGAILQIMSKESDISRALLGYKGNEAAQTQLLLNLAKTQTAEYQKQLLLAKQLAITLSRGGVAVGSAGLQIGRKSANGFIPSSIKSAEKRGARDGGYAPGSVVSAPKNIGGVMNTAEEVKYVPGFAQPFINPPESSRAGRVHRKNAIKQTGIDPYNYLGFIPNFADIDLTNDKRLGIGYSGLSKGPLDSKIDREFTAKYSELNPTAKRKFKYVQDPIISLTGVVLDPLNFDPDKLIKQTINNPIVSERTGRTYRTTPESQAGLLLEKKLGLPGGSNFVDAPNINAKVSKKDRQKYSIDSDGPNVYRDLELKLREETIKDANIISKFINYYPSASLQAFKFNRPSKFDGFIPNFATPQEIEANILARKRGVMSQITALNRTNPSEAQRLMKLYEQTQVNKALNPTTSEQNLLNKASSAQAQRAEKSNIAIARGTDYQKVNFAWSGWDQAKKGAAKEYLKGFTTQARAKKTEAQIAGAANYRVGGVFENVVLSALKNTKYAGAVSSKLLGLKGSSSARVDAIDKATRTIFEIKADPSAKPSQLQEKFLKLFEDNEAFFAGTKPTDWKRIFVNAVQPKPGQKDGFVKAFDEGFIPNFAHILGKNKDNIAIRSVTSPLDKQGNRQRGSGAVKNAILAAIDMAKKNGLSKISADIISEPSLNAFKKYFGTAKRGKNVWNVSEFKNVFGGFIPNFADMSKVVRGRNIFQIKWMKDMAKKRGLNLEDPEVMKKLGAEFAKKYPNEQLMMGLSNGFIPNFAYKQAVMDLEERMSGSDAIYSETPFPHIRNKSQPTFADAIADHGGLKNALKDSIRHQAAVGLAAGGFVPNFAPTPQKGKRYTSEELVGTDIIQFASQAPKEAAQMAGLNNALEKYENMVDATTDELKAQKAVIVKVSNGLVSLAQIEEDIKKSGQIRAKKQLEANQAAAKAIQAQNDETDKAKKLKDEKNKLTARIRAAQAAEERNNQATNANTSAQNNNTKAQKNNTSSKNQNTKSTQANQKAGGGFSNFRMGLGFAGPMIAGLAEQYMYGDKTRAELTEGQRFGKSFLSTGLTAISTGASIGGPWGALAGGAVALVGAFNALKLSTKELAESIDQNFAKQKEAIDTFSNALAGLEKATISGKEFEIGVAQEELVRSLLSVPTSLQKPFEEIRKMEDPAEAREKLNGLFQEISKSNRISKAILAETDYGDIFGKRDFWSKLSDRIISSFESVWIVVNKAFTSLADLIGGWFGLNSESQPRHSEARTEVMNSPTARTQMQGFYIRGGIIKANNGMFVDGNGSGDKYPALLENGEYVLNRNAVKALGGKTVLDNLNFVKAPRFQAGGPFGLDNINPNFNQTNSSEVQELINQLQQLTNAVQKANQEYGTITMEDVAGDKTYDYTIQKQNIGDLEINAPEVTQEIEKLKPLLSVLSSSNKDSVLGGIQFNDEETKNILVNILNELKKEDEDKKAWDDFQKEITSLESLIDKARMKDRSAARKRQQGSTRENVAAENVLFGDSSSSNFLSSYLDEALNLEGGGGGVLKVKPALSTQSFPGELDNRNRINEMRKLNRRYEANKNTAISAFAAQKGEALPFYQEAIEKYEKTTGDDFQSVLTRLTETQSIEVRENIIDKLSDILRGQGLDPEKVAQFAQYLSESSDAAATAGQKLELANFEDLVEGSDELRKRIEEFANSMGVVASNIKELRYGFEDQIIAARNSIERNKIIDAAQLERAGMGIQEQISEAQAFGRPTEAINLQRQATELNIQAFEKESQRAFQERYLGSVQSISEKIKGEGDYTAFLARVNELENQGIDFEARNDFIEEYVNMLKDLDGEQKRTFKLQLQASQNTLDNSKLESKERRKTADYASVQAEEQAAQQRSFSYQFDASLSKMSDTADLMMGQLGAQIPQAFADGITNALMDAAKGAKSIEDAFKDVAINFGQMIMQEVMRALISKMVSKAGTAVLGMFGQSGGSVSSKGIGHYQTGGVIRANNGMFVNGSGSGDRYPAMLENGEYVLNRNAVSMMGGKNVLDRLNFQNAPRFAVGGGFSTVVDKNKKNKDISSFSFDSGSASFPLDEGLYTARALEEDEYFKNLKQESYRKAQQDAQEKYQKKVRDLQLITGIMSAVGGLMVSVGPAIGAAAAGSQASNAAGQAGMTAFQEGAMSGTTEAAQEALGQVQTPKQMAQVMKQFSSEIEIGGKTLSSLNQSLNLDALAKAGTNLADLPASALENLSSFSKGFAGTKELTNVLKSQGIAVNVKTNFFTRDLSKYKFFSTLDKLNPSSVTAQNLTSAQSIIANYGGRRQAGGYIGYNSGGFVPHGSRLSDTIPALLTGGEYVMNNSAVKKYGLNTMNAMNAGSYQSGGTAMNSATTSNNTSNNNTNVSISIDRSGNAVYGSDTSSYDKKDVVISKQMATEINKIVLRSMSNEKRYGGELYKNPLRT